MANERFQDPGRRSDDFWPMLVLAECPRCGGCASIRPERPDLWQLVPRTLACARCGCIETHDGRQLRFQEGVDPFFGHPLWLRTEVAGALLWAWNPEHLAFLKAFVGADLRERLPLPPEVPAGGGPHARNTLLTSRLPRWMKLAKNRDAVLHAIARLEERLGVGAGRT